MNTTPFPIHLINPQAIEVCRILHNSNYQAYIVGGCVRDLLLGVEPKDWDICTDARPEKVMELFPKNYPTGLQHGTVTVAMGEGSENHFEVTTFRVEGKYLDGRRPEEVSFVTSVEEDLGRRDLTINAMAYSPITDHLSDPYEGMKDLQNGVIKAVGNANLRFQEDGLRIMRVARFAARFGYQVEESTIEGMKNNLETLKKVSKERVKDELCKTLMAKNPSVGFRLLALTGVLPLVAPKIYCQADSPDFEFKGDLETRLVSVYMLKGPSGVEEEMNSLKFSNKEIKKVFLLFQLMGEYYKYSYKLQTVKSYRRFMGIIKNQSEDWKYTLEQFCLLCDMCQIPIRDKLEEFKDEEVFSRKEMAINGNDLMEIGVPKGPKLKEILDFCYEQIIEDPSQNLKSNLVDFVKNLFKKL